MQSISFLLFCLAVFPFQFGLSDVVNKRASCNADNCLRNIRGTALATPNLTSRRADCSSFLRTTIQPEPTTITVTETVNPVPKRDLGDGSNPGLIQARQTTTTTTPKNVPTYASACSGTARYSSACSCAGVTGVTTTAPASTITVTVTECDIYSTKCNGICRDLYYDTNNCGTCGNVCPRGAQCRGQCLFPKDFECGPPSSDPSNGVTAPCTPQSTTCICAADPGSSRGGTCIRTRQSRFYCIRYPKCPGGTNAECPANSFCWSNAPCLIPVCVDQFGWCEDMTRGNLLME